MKYRLNRRDSGDAQFDEEVGCFLGVLLFMAIVIALVINGCSKNRVEEAAKQSKPTSRALHPIPNGARPAWEPDESAEMARVAPDAPQPMPIGVHPITPDEREEMARAIQSGKENAPLTIGAVSINKISEHLLIFEFQPRVGWEPKGEADCNQIEVLLQQSVQKWKQENLDKVIVDERLLKLKPTDNVSCPQRYRVMWKERY